MSTQQKPAAQENAAIVRALYDMFNTRDFDRTASIVTEDYAGVVVPLGTRFDGVAGARDFQLGWATAFPDSQVEIRSMTVDGDRVVVEHNGRGTHLGPLETPNGPVAATGRRVDIPFCEVFEVRGGKVARARTYFDVGTMMGQLGVAAPAEAAAPESGNVALARRWFDAMSSGRLDEVTSIFASSYRLHYPDIDTSATGPEVIRGLVGAYREAFPDLTFAIEDAIGSGETVMVRWTASGTNRGSLLGAPATGRFARWAGMSVFRVRDGRIVEDWVENDRLGMLQQLGLAPVPEAHAVA